MILHSIATRGIVLAKIDVARVHAAEIYVAPAVGEFFDCKRWCHHTGSVFAGRWTDVEAAHAMLGMIRSAMEREFAEFIRIAEAGDDQKSLAASFSRGMGLRISERLRRRKAGRKDVLAIANELARRSVAPFRRAVRMLRRSASWQCSTAYAAGVEAGDRLRFPVRGRLPQRARRPRG